MFESNVHAEHVHTSRLSQPFRGEEGGRGGGEEGVGRSVEQTSQDEVYAELELLNVQHGHVHGAEGAGLLMAKGRGSGGRGIEPLLTFKVNFERFIHTLPKN